MKLIRHEKLLSLFLVVTTAFVFSRCSSGPCNNIPQRPLPSPSPSPLDGVYSSMTSTAATPSPSPSPTPPVHRDPTILVFKPTGERQCQTGTATNLEDVKNDLTSRNIPVFESRTQADGLMHMALCGTPTGTVHVFMIPAKLKLKAQKLGFREFKGR